MTRRRSFRNAAQLLVAVLLLPVAAAASDVSDEHARALVDSFVNDVRTFSGNFEQTLLDANGDLLETSSGRLDIHRPGRFRWEYDSPYEQWLVADGVNIWSYDVDLAQVTVKPQSEALANTPATLLGGGKDAMDEFAIEPAAPQGSPDDGLTTWVRLTPVDAESGFRHVDLGFVADTLTRMVFLDNLEQTTIVSLSQVAVDKPVDPGRFQFVVPDDVDVVGTPASINPP
jgi:outer membrane lipoprotein carrier protein